MSVEFTLLWAKNIKEEDGITKNDLYAVITYGGQKVTSKVAKDGLLSIGYKYSWDQAFSFDLKADDDIEVKLYDKDIGLDDFVGEAKFLLHKAKSAGSSEDTVDVITKGKVKGQIHGKIAIRR